MLHSVIAVVGGFVSTVLLVMVGTAAASASLLRGDRDANATVPASYLTANLILSFLAAVAGGYACGWLAPSRPLIHATVLATVFGGLSLSTALSQGASPGQPRWYPWVIGLICMAGVVTGGVLRRPLAVH